MSEQNQTPLTAEELDTADAALTGRPTLAEQLGWSKDDYAAVESAWNHEFPDSKHQSEPDPALQRVLERVKDEQPPIQPVLADATPKSSRTRRSAPIRERDRLSARKKLAANLPMTAREVAAELGCSIKSVYDNHNLELHPTGSKKRLWTAASVNAILKSPY